jgi:hypothetical protein
VRISLIDPAPGADLVDNGQARNVTATTAGRFWARSGQYSRSAGPDSHLHAHLLGHLPGEVPAPEAARLGFAVHLFCGLLPWIAFSETLQRSTTVVRDNANPWSSEWSLSGGNPPGQYRPRRGCYSRSIGTTGPAGGGHALLDRGTDRPRCSGGPRCSCPQLAGDAGSLPGLSPGIPESTFVIPPRRFNLLPDVVDVPDPDLLSLNRSYQPSYAWIVRWNPIGTPHPELPVMPSRGPATRLEPDSAQRSTFAAALLGWQGSWWFERTRGDFADLL